MSIKTGKNFLFFIQLLLVTGIGFNAKAQDDSIHVVHAHWKTQVITKGVTLKQFWFHNTLFHSNQNITLLEINPNGQVKLGVEGDRKILRKTNEICKAANAIAAINGAFFDIKNGGSVAFFRKNGEIINENKLYKNGQRKFFQKVALVFKKGKVHIARWNGKENWEKQLDGDDILLSGPLLVDHGKIQSLDSLTWNSNGQRAPRSAIAITRNRVLLITVDGRNENAAGMTLPELGKLLFWLKSKYAVNLDGGGSTSLWVYNQPGNGIVNFPTDNKAWDQEGVRKVANAIVVKK
jgi:exopolysaccharide biosynthesis protein